MPVARMRRPAWNCVAQVAQDGLGWKPRCVCLPRVFFLFIIIFFNIYYRCSDNTGVAPAACWQRSGLSLEKAMHEMHRGRRWYSSLIIRPHQLPYGFVNVKLAKRQLGQTLRGEEKETRARARRQKMGRVLEGKKKVRTRIKQPGKKKKNLERKLTDRATDAEYCAHLFGACCVNGYVNRLW